MTKEKLKDLARIYDERLKEDEKELKRSRDNARLKRNCTVNCNRKMFYCSPSRDDSVKTGESTMLFPFIPKDDGKPLNDSSSDTIKFECLPENRKNNINQSQIYHHLKNKENQIMSSHFFPLRTSGSVSDRIKQYVDELKKPKGTPITTKGRNGRPRRTMNMIKFEPIDNRLIEWQKRIDRTNNFDKQYRSMNEINKEKFLTITKRLNHMLVSSSENNLTGKKE
ncbi:hypothetical protein SNEBB_000150 [Seison nebaliae]|nr:hypothetical protein SNEBB_000150 [Seison nebaliae]